MIKMNKTDETQKVVYATPQHTLRIGDELTFIPHPASDTFYNSNIGKLFEKGICDELNITVKEKEWLEVYFLITLKLNGKLITNSIRYDEISGDDAWDNAIHSEESGYMFIRYLLGKE